MSTDLDELERHIRENVWTDIGQPRPALADEDRAIAAKLLGRDNYNRLARAKSGERVKYRPLVVTAEYHFFPSAVQALTDHWVITMVENGKRRPLDVWLTQEQCVRAVRWLESKGIKVKRADTEYMRGRHVTPPAKHQQQRSKRFDPEWLRRATT